MNIKCPIEGFKKVISALEQAYVAYGVWRFKN